MQIYSMVLALFLMTVVKQSSSIFANERAFCPPKVDRPDVRRDDHRMLQLWRSVATFGHHIRFHP